MKTMMILGASGLIGSQLVEKARCEGMRVIAVSRENFGDLTDIGTLENLPMADYIIHAAGYGQPSKYMANPISTIKLSAMVTMQLFEHLWPDGRFLFISTSEVYSGLTNTLCKESQIGTTNTDHPRACYIEGKRCAEAITLINKGKVVRLCLTYGPGTKKNDGRAMNQFIYKALFNKEIKLIDDGSAVRTYCYISDAIEMIWRVFMEGRELIYNVGSKSKTTILDMAKKIGLYMNVPVILPSESHGLIGSPSDVCVDITRYENEFGKKDFISLDEGLKRTIEYQKELYK
jgi:UDP-glucuronate decarboxylase